MKVLMVGNSPTVKGGITSVISQLLHHDWKSNGIEMSFIPSYAGGNNTKKYCTSCGHIFESSGR